MESTPPPPPGPDTEKKRGLERVKELIQNGEKQKGDNYKTVKTRKQTANVTKQRILQNSDSYKTAKIIFFPIKYIHNDIKIVPLSIGILICYSP